MPEETVTQARIDFELEKIKQVGNQLPGIVTLHNLRAGKIEWMCDYGLEMLGVTKGDIFDKPLLDLVEKFFHPVDISENIPRILAFLHRSKADELITYYERVKVKGMRDWSWFMGCAKILLRDVDNKPVLCTCTSFPINSMDQFAQKTARILDENQFVSENYKVYALLTEREKEVLKLWAMGRNAPETAKELFISGLTVATHRKRIKKKLQVNTVYEVQQYAIAFDLV